MGLKLADAFVYLATDDSKLKSGFASAEQQTSSFAGKASKLLGGALVGGALAAGAAVVGIGKAAMSVEAEYDNAMDAIINATGASGKTLKDMGQGVLDLASSVQGFGFDMEQIGATMGEVNTRTGATGDTLNALTGDILEFTRLTGGDAVENTRLLTRTMGDWGVSVEESAGLLDTMYGAGQAFGIGFDSLSQKLVQFGAPLRQMGFGLEESIAMLGKWEKEGVNTELVIGSLRIAAGKFARDNVPLRDGLNQTMEAIKGAASESDALALAMDVFGARAGPDMAAAIREGRFELDEAIATLQDTQGGLDDAAARTIDFREEWQVAMRSIAVELLPVGQAMAEMMQALLPGIVKGVRAVVQALAPFITGMAALIQYFAFLAKSGDYANDWLTHLPEPIAVVVEKIGQFITRLGNLRDKLTEGEGAIGGFGDKYAFVGERLEGIMTAAKTLVENVLNAIKGFWETNGETIKTIVGNIWSAIETTFRTALDVILGLVEFWLQLLSGDFEGAGETLKGVATTLWEGVKEIFRLQLDNIGLLITGIDWAGLGTAILQGIANGITGAAGMLADAAREAAQRAYEAAKSWLGISSPSKKTAEKIGKPFVEGIGEGIRDSMRDLQGSVNLGLGSMFSGMQMAGASAETAVNITINVSGNAGTGQAARSGVLSALRQAGLA